MYRAALNRQRDSQRPAKLEFKRAKNLENRGPGGMAKMDQISILDALVALGLSWWRLGNVLGSVLGPS